MEKTNVRKYPVKIIIEDKFQRLEIMRHKRGYSFYLDVTTPFFNLRKTGMVRNDKDCIGNLDVVRSKIVDYVKKNQRPVDECGTNILSIIMPDGTERGFDTFTIDYDSFKKGCKQLKKIESVCKEFQGFDALFNLADICRKHEKEEQSNIENQDSVEFPIKCFMQRLLVEHPSYFDKDGKFIKCGKNLFRHVIDLMRQKIDEDRQVKVLSPNKGRKWKE